MGTRGKGALTKPKPPKLPTGRPRNTVSDEVYKALRAPTMRAIAVLDRLLKSADERTRLLAAKALVELGSRPPSTPSEDPNAPPPPMEVRVNYANDYRASTG